MTRSAELYDAALRVDFVLSRPENWLQGYAGGVRVSYDGSPEWTKEAPADEMTCLCLGTALRVSGADDKVKRELHAKIKGAIIALGYPNNHIVSFNDDERTRYVDVRRVIDYVVESVKPEPVTPVVVSSGDGWAL